MNLRELSSHCNGTTDNLRNKRHGIWRFALLGWILALTGCASEPELVPYRYQQASISPALGNVEFHTSQLADELFVRLRPDPRVRYAVVQFVPIDTLSFAASEQHPLQMLGHQLEQGMMTEAYRRGFITQDYKIMNDIKLERLSETVQSRNQDDLGPGRNIDFFITGTITLQEAGAMVNARVVDVRTKDVLAAATKFFPGELFWQREHITERQGKLIRTSMQVR